MVAGSYTPAGQVLNAVKPNHNTVTSTYYANELPFTVTEKTSGGTLVSSHQYAYDPDGNTTQNIEQLMSADPGGGDLSHTLGYTYSPMDQVATVTTDGTPTESYTHDAGNNVTSQQITSNGTTTTTNYGYDQGRLVTASTGGTTADYNYDPFGRLDTVTAAGQTLQSNTYNGFDNLASTSQLNTSTGSMDTTSYTYDSLNRMASQTTAAGTTAFSYLGLSSEVASESDPGSTSKTYDYTPGGARLSQDTTSGGTTTPGYYSYNAHSDVEALTGPSGTTTATYGYTAYGNPVTSMFTGQDKNDATSSATSTTQPYSSYRFNAMRWDGTTGQYDMGFRNYDPGINQFASRDMYNGALADAGLATDPFTGSQYAFGGGNPVTNIENNGHSWLSGITGAASRAVSSVGSCLGPETSCAPDYFNVPPGQQNNQQPPSPRRQISNFSNQINTTLNASRNEQGCVSDTLDAFWGAYGYPTCGILGTPTYNQQAGTLVWTLSGGAGITTHLVCNWIQDCLVSGSASISIGNGQSTTIGAKFSLKTPSVQLSLAAPGEGTDPESQGWPIGVAARNLPPGTRTQTIAEQVSQLGLDQEGAASASDAAARAAFNDTGGTVRLPNGNLVVLPKMLQNNAWLEIGAEGDVTAMRGVIGMTAEADLNLSEVDWIP